jgi:hypothetical protein
MNRSEAGERKVEGPRVGVDHRGYAHGETDKAVQSRPVFFTVPHRTTELFGIDYRGMIVSAKNRTGRLIVSAKIGWGD